MNSPVKDGIVDSSGNRDNTDSENYQKQSKNPSQKRCIKALAGAFSGIIMSSLLHPLDLVKVRLQVHRNNASVIEMSSKIMRCEGFSALYNGMSASIMRQATNTTTRLSVYYWLYDHFTEEYDIFPNLSDKIVIGMYAGLAGALAGNPSEVALVRMMADGCRDPCCPRERKRPKLYNGALHAVYKIASTEGVMALWRGATLTLARSACMSVVQIGSYAKTRELLLKRHLASKEDKAGRAILHTYSSFISSFLTAILTLPVDTIKTKYQIRSDEISPSQLCVTAFKREGVGFFWRGFLAYFLRMSIHTTLSYFILLEIGDFLH